MAYYVAINTEQQIVIDGIGDSPDGAWADVVDMIGTFSDDDGETIDADHARNDWTISTCTDALYNQVAAEGGAISWGKLPDGTICTDSEECAPAL